MSLLHEISQNHAVPGTGVNMHIEYNADQGTTLLLAGSALGDQIKRELARKTVMRRDRSRLSFSRDAQEVFHKHGTGPYGDVASV